MNELFTEIQKAAGVIASPNCADMAAVIISVIALVVSTIVAFLQVKISNKQAEISEQQNRIALFEKRHEVYRSIQDCNHFAWLICTFAKDNEDLRKLFILSRNNIETVESDVVGFDVTVTRGQILEFIRNLSQAEFLFSHDIIDYATSLMIELQLIVTSCLLLKNESITNMKESLKTVLDRYDAEKIDDKIVEELRPIIPSQKCKLR